ncbi:MAG: GTP 3',8-cyclase MoaA [Marinicellaceae bacterium]
MKMKKITDQFNRPIKDLRISVMDTCNYRCPYCMPAEKFDENYKFLSPDQRLNFDEICEIVNIFSEFGVSKIRLTGGEPLLRKNLPNLIHQLKSIANIDDIALTTNGQLLKKQLPALIEAGLDRINISLDTINPELYHKMSGYKGHLKKVLEGIDFAIHSPLKSIKLNCVVQLGINHEEIIPLLEKYRDTRAVVRFIEYMDVGTKNDWEKSKVMPYKDILKIIESQWPLETLEPHYRGEVANRYRYKDNAGEIGFITSITEPFCQDCSRARLSADGKLYTCLFAHKYHDLKSFLRNKNNKETLQNHIKNIWLNRNDRYSEIRHELKQDNNKKIEMYVIGG